VTQFFFDTGGGAPWDFNRGECYNEITRIVDEEYPCETYVLSFTLALWALDSTVRSEMNWTFGIAFFMCTIFSAIFIPNVWLVATVLFNLMLTELAVVGVIYWLGLRIDFILLVILTLSMGLVVDFSVHVAMKYFELTKLRRVAKLTIEIDGKTHRSHFVEFFSSRERVSGALSSMGGALLCVGVSTVLGSVVLIWCRNKLLANFGKEIVAITVIGLFVSLTFLPASLIMVGSLTDKGSMDSQKDDGPMKYSRNMTIGTAMRGGHQEPDGNREKKENVEMIQFCTPERSPAAGQKYLSSVVKGCTPEASLTPAAILMPQASPAEPVFSVVTSPVTPQQSPHKQSDSVIPLRSDSAREVKL